MTLSELEALYYDEIHQDSPAAIDERWFEVFYSLR
jgi:hypothetical protein